MTTDKKLQSAPAAGDRPYNYHDWSLGYSEGLWEAAGILRQHLPLYEDSKTALVLQDMIDLIEEESSK